MFHCFSNRALYRDLQIPHLCRCPGQQFTSVLFPSSQGGETGEERWEGKIQPIHPLGSDCGSPHYTMHVWQTTSTILCSVLTDQNPTAKASSETSVFRRWSSFMQPTSLSLESMVAEDNVREESSPLPNSHGPGVEIAALLQSRNLQACRTDK